MFFSAMRPSAGPTVLLSAGIQKLLKLALPFGAGRSSNQRNAQHVHTKACARFRKTSCEKRSLMGP
jgi:hypothetical protein